MKLREAATAIIAAVVAIYWVTKDWFVEPQCLYTSNSTEGNSKSIWTSCDAPPEWWKSGQDSKTQASKELEEHGT